MTQTELSLRNPFRILPYIALCAVMLPGHALADEPFGLSLLDDNSLAGWEHSAQPATGWTIENGTLRGTKESTPLLSGWSFGNFELRFRWSVIGDGALKIHFPAVPSGKQLEVDLSGHFLVWHQFGAHGEKVIEISWKTAVDALQRSQQKVNEGVIRRQAELFVVTINEQEVGRAKLPPDVRLGLSISMLNEGGVVSDMRVQEFAANGDPAGTPMFNGKDLSGWWTPGNKDAWAAKDGTIALVGGGGNYLRSEKEYGNFTLSLEYKIRKKGNSGVGIRTARNGWPSGDGMEMQIEDSRPLDGSATMGIYRNIEPLRLAEKTEEWNQAVIKADGRMVSAWLNGVLVQQVNTQFLPELRHRPLKGWIGFQDHNAPIQFRNIRIIEAPDGLGLDAWYAPRNEPASRLVLDRLMNPERLTLRDGSHSGAVSSTINDGGEHVLADLTGPGALVRITRSKDAGKLAFYFDGEAKPRIECPVGELNKRVPQLTGDGNPVLTFLGYEKNLKVVLRDAKSADYRLEYMTLPPEMPVETFRDKNKSIARGMLPAIDYRHFQMSYGTYRDNDPLPRKESDAVAIAPGAKVDLISLPGGGMIKWLKLRCDPKLLANDDLWLEVNIDGEPKPALAAPARFLFPGLDQGKNYHNFLVFNKGGFANVLPMPYGKGISIAAINRGGKEVKGIAASVSYQPEEASNAAPASNRLHLRGVFVDATNSSASSEPLSFTGAGRWVGLVCQTPDSNPTLTLQLDGQPQPGWEHSTWQQLVGVASSQEQTRCLSGQSKSLSWCFHLLAPTEFQRSFRLQSEGTLGSRLALFYSE